MLPRADGDWLATGLAGVVGPPSLSSHEVVLPFVALPELRALLEPIAASLVSLARFNRHLDRRGDGNELVRQHVQSATALLFQLVDRAKLDNRLIRILDAIRAYF